MAAKSNDLVSGFSIFCSHVRQKKINLNHFPIPSLFHLIALSGSLAKNFHLTISTRSVCVPRFCGHFHWIGNKKRKIRMRHHPIQFSYNFSFRLRRLCTFAAISINCIIPSYRISVQRSFQHIGIGSFPREN